MALGYILIQYFIQINSLQELLILIIFMSLSGHSMATETHFDHDYGQQLANPPHIQKIERALRLESFLSHVETIIQPTSDSDTDIEKELLKPCGKDAEGNKILNGITITKAGKLFEQYSEL